MLEISSKKDSVQKSEKIWEIFIEIILWREEKKYMELCNES